MQTHPPRLLGRGETLPMYNRLKEDDSQSHVPDIRAPSASAPNLPTDVEEFTWNGRHCAGKQIHKAALAGDVAQATRILDFEPSERESRFTYQTFYKGKPQEGSGLAIHLAASRGHTEMMDLLLSRGASLRAMVTRDGRDHYDVMHAAVFAEGRNDNVKMVRYLIEQKAPIEENSDNCYPLHIAFRVGSLDIIKLLRKEMKKLGILERAQLTCGDSPLLLGIKTGKMTTPELAKAAAHTPLSLRTFIENEPRCIPRFLQELEQKDAKVTSTQLAKHLGGADLARVMRRAPDAALALFDALLVMPDVEHPGWHPLPRRVSFASSDWHLVLRHLVNPRKDILVHYVEESAWTYNVESFEQPEWHEDFLSPTYGDPVHDVTVKLCRVPNLLVAEFFTGMAEADSDGELAVFDHAVVSGSIYYVWWNGAWRVDVLHAVLGLWSLGLLILESWIVGGDVQARNLKAKHSESSIGESIEELLPTTSGLVGEIAISAAFIGAKGVIDVLHELAQFVGSVRIGRPLDYLGDAGNLWDLARGLVLMSIFFDPMDGMIRVMVIFICWMRLLEMFTSAENVALALLPLKRLGRALVPSIMMTLVAFMCFTHVFHYVWGHDHNWEATFFQSFATLITTELPQNPWDCSWLELFVTYGAVLFFSIFMLNIFIGVIGTTYEQEQERVPQTFLHHRACCCLNFLLRARVIPCNLCSRLCANICTAATLSLCVITQVQGLIYQNGGLFARIIFIFSQALMLLAAYQTPGLCWCPMEDNKRYLWLTTPCNSQGDQVPCSCGCLIPEESNYCSRCGKPKPGEEESFHQTRSVDESMEKPAPSSFFRNTSRTSSRLTW